MTIDKSTLERFNSLKEELNEQQDGPDHSADTFLQGLMDTWEAVDEGHYNSDVEELVEELKDELSMANDPGEEVDVEGLYDEIEKVQELVEKVPDETAEEFGRKYA